MYSTALKEIDLVLEGNTIMNYTARTGNSFQTDYHDLCAGYSSIAKSQSVLTVN